LFNVVRIIIVALMLLVCFLGIDALSYDAEFVNYVL